MGNPPGPDGTIPSEGEGGEMSEEAQKKMESEMNNSLPVFMETMVSASLVDVEVTLKQVCKKVSRYLEEHEGYGSTRLRSFGDPFQLPKGG